MDSSIEELGPVFLNFFGAFIGSVIVTFTVMFLYINEYLKLDLLKLK